MSDQGASQLITALRMRGGFETVNQHLAPGQFRLSGRVRKPAMDGWLLVMDYLIMKEEEAAWSVDISKKYLRSGGKLMFAWRFILQAEDVAQYLSPLATLIMKAPRARVYVDEQALPGVGGNRNAPSGGNRGKGAQDSLKAIVGPMAIASMNRGG